MSTLAGRVREELTALRVLGLKDSDRAAALRVQLDASRTLQRARQRARIAAETKRIRAKRDAAERLERQREREAEAASARREARQWLENRARFAPGHMVEFEATMDGAERAGLDPALVASVGHPCQRRGDWIEGGLLALSADYKRRDYFDLDRDGPPAE